MTRELAALIEDGELREFYVQFLGNTIEVSKRWQRRLMGTGHETAVKP